jgi:hypothetical protein
MDVACMFSLRDFDLVLLIEEILEKKVYIKTNIACKDRFMLAQWCKEKKLDHIIMSKLM